MGGGNGCGCHLRHGSSGETDHRDRDRLGAAAAPCSDIAFEYETKISGTPARLRQNPVFLRQHLTGAKVAPTWSKRETRRLLRQEHELPVEGAVVATEPAAVWNLPDGTLNSA